MENDGEQLELWDSRDPDFWQRTLAQGDTDEAEDAETGAESATSEPKEETLDDKSEFKPTQTGF